MLKVLVLGSTGMLGSMVYDYLANIKDIELLGTYFNERENRPFDQNSKGVQFDASRDVEVQLQNIFAEFLPAYIINCIGIIKPYCNDKNMSHVVNAIKVNALFPIILSNESNKLSNKPKIIQIATDCVFDGLNGGYIESDLHNPTDVYGKTKSLGEVIDDNFLNIRCSIIGPEINNGKSLMEWLLSHPNNATVNGYDDHIWNGVTTLQFAQFCESIMMHDEFLSIRRLNHVVHYISNSTVTKYELLTLINDIFKRTIQIQHTANPGRGVDRSLATSLMPLEQRAMRESIEMLQLYVHKSKLFGQ